MDLHDHGSILNVLEDGFQPGDAAFNPGLIHDIRVAGACLPCSGIQIVLDHERERTLPSDLFGNFHSGQVTPAGPVGFPGLLIVRRIPELLIAGRFPDHIIIRFADRFFIRLLFRFLGKQAESAVHGEGRCTHHGGHNDGQYR